jgi:serine phosphatase RsbU (regulator of sigma subunit)
VRELLAGLVAQGGQALARARAFEETTAAATALQTSLLPSVLAQRSGLALAVRYTPGLPGPGKPSGGGVGGDWYDCVEVDEHRVALVVGDVMGKGLHAAAVMGQMRTTVRALTAIDPSPRVVLAALDRITRDLSDDVITTVAYVLLDTDAGSAQVGRAGHLPPLLVAPDGSVRTLESGGSPPLGAPVEKWGQSDVDVPAGSLLVLYSDGLVGSRRTGLEPGLSELTDAVAGLAAAGTDVDRMAGAVMDRLVGAERDDDITLLLVQLVGAPLPAQGEPSSAG